MKTRKHGKGLNHKQVVDFSNRLMYSGKQPSHGDEYLEGWYNACKYFAHELRKTLRYYEQINEI